MRTTLASCSLTSFTHALKVSQKRNSRWRSWQLHLQADNAMYVSFSLIYWLIMSPRRSEISVPMPDRLVCFSPFLCFCAYLFLISRFEIMIYLRSWAPRLTISLLLTLLLVRSTQLCALKRYPATKPGKWFVDVFPFCGCLSTFLTTLIHSLLVKYVPSWFPGAGFKKTAAQYRKINMDQTDLPFQFVIKGMVCLHTCTLKVY